MADLELVRSLGAADHGLVVLATTRADRTVQASVVNAGVLANPLGDGDVVAAVAAAGTAKLANLRRFPHATVVFRAGWEWVAVEGATTIVGPDDPADGFAPDRLPQLLRDVFSAAGGTHDDWDEYDRVMATERRAAVLVTPERITTNAGA
ncbi:MAG: TIGR03618 family F420-dependent PPOX class oxidoreductase [Actinobacteria bacterium]|nr:TIGR03618 family F420-dependent PPOX class oxidoreductase [Actinomycetota bacterium]